MTPIAYVKNIWTQLLPAAMKTKMDLLEQGTKDACDTLDLETDAGRAVTQAATAEDQREALDVDSKAEVTAKASAAQSAAEGTAAAALAGHVAAADPHAQYALESAMTPALAAKADLVDGKVPSTQLPAYVDDVLEYTNLAAFPVSGESGKIYVALDTSLTYRWSGSAYVEISKSLALGESSSTAYRGDRGAELYALKGYIPTTAEKAAITDLAETAPQVPWSAPRVYLLDPDRYHLERISGGRASIRYSTAGKVPIEVVWLDAFTCADVSPDFSRSRANSTAYGVGALLMANSQLYEVTTAGTTGSSVPAYPSNVGDTVVDGTATLTLRVNAYNDIYPAFSVAGVKKPGRWISRFLCDVVSGKPRSIAGQFPAYATIDQIRAYAIAFGNGALPMSYWDYEALACDAFRKGIVPVGNTYYGRSHKTAESVWGGVRADGARPGDAAVTSNPVTRGGSAGVIWTHDRSMWGVHDFVGNYYRWVDGAKYMDGELYIHAYDNDPTLLTAAGEGSWIPTGIFLNAPAAGDDAGSNDLGAPNFAAAVTNYTASVVPTRDLATIKADTRDLDYASQTWSSIAVAASIDAVDAVKRITAFRMGILPKVRSGGASPLSTQEGRLWIRNNGERFALRAGDYGDASNAGPKYCNALHRRSYSSAFGVVFPE